MFASSIIGEALVDGICKKTIFVDPSERKKVRDKTKTLKKDCTSASRSDYTNDSPEID